MAAVINLGRERALRRIPVTAVGAHYFRVRRPVIRRLLRVANWIYDLLYEELPAEDA